MIAKIKQLIAKALELLDHVLGILRVHLAFIHPVAPSTAPKMWIYINGTCCMLNAMFFLGGMMHDKTTGFEFAETFYIPFNLIMCGIWFVEASLWLIFDEEEPAWHKIGELLLSVFFIFDAVIWIYEWVFEGTQLQRREILIYTAIDFLIYLFYLVLAIRAEAKKCLQEEEAIMKGGDVESVAVVSPSDQKEANAEFKLMA